jgi:hypothetical protein
MAEPDPPRPAPRTYAKEDPQPAVVFGEIVVEASRLSLDEILEHCIEAEKNKYRDLDDIAFTATEKVVVHYGKVGDEAHRRDVFEEVSRCYHKRPDLSRNVSLGRRETSTEDGKPREDETGGHEDEGDNASEGDEKGEGNEIAISVGSGTDAFTDLPFFFEDLSRYRFDILDRKDLEARVLYHIAFEPRSDFLQLPSGRFWVDTADFQIFHASLKWTDNLPVPILLKGLDYVAIEKKRVGDHWVYDRVSGRVKLRKIPLVKLPSEVEFSVVYDEYALNEGIPPGVFDEEAR